jgi:hypothetical protein
MDDSKTLKSTRVIGISGPKVIAFALALLASGRAAHAYVSTELKVTNNSGGAIQFYSSHTKKTTSIDAGVKQSVPHSSGRIIIVTHDDNVWEYDNVNIADYSNESIEGFKKLTLPIAVESDGTIRLPSGKKMSPSHSLLLK